MTRPSFRNTKGEQKRADNVIGMYDPHHRYREIAATIYEWEGLPDDVPLGYIERSLYDYGAVGLKRVEGLGDYILPAGITKIDPYGNPITWTPIHVRGQPTQDLLSETDSPVLQLPAPTRHVVDLYVDIQMKAYASLRQNALALSQPVALTGSPGNDAESIVLATEFVDGNLFIPVVDLTRFSAEVIDLKAQDHTASLTTLANAMDNEILTILGIQNTGTQKASGINIAEATSLHQELRLTSDHGLRLRQKWCDKTNERFGTGIDVYISSSYAEPEPVMETIDKGRDDEQYNMD